jgi:hypothetical protein
MIPDFSSAHLRQMLAKHFGRYGVDVQSQDIQERERQQDGRRVACSYRAGGLLAMWFVDSDFVQIYDSSGQMLETLRIVHQEQHDRRAA